MEYCEGNKFHKFNLEGDLNYHIKKRKDGKKI